MIFKKTCLTVEFLIHKGVINSYLNQKCEKHTLNSTNDLLTTQRKKKAGAVSKIKIMPFGQKKS
ncbi:hypothetical protein EI976_15040 [Bacillus licheniformis]|nr:hypothetical protein C1T27_19185 [Bacillus licheniformis]KUL12089.1 hypothetical protein LI17339_06295 [Bacillus licheniformis LMG 17339]KAA0808884.1 hypothetical protein EI978_17760 [Bacillus licheniformis]KAA0822353.1 hypothetical protein EI976_15040 [Bacillus licheniformis]KAA0824407.1 hypothetical protein EI973_14380 [Bacillus licheniformis]